MNMNRLIFLFQMCMKTVKALPLHIDINESDINEIYKALHLKTVKTFSLEIDVNVYRKALHLEIDMNQLRNDDFACKADIKQSKKGFSLWKWP